jgi:peptide-methionine (S)-S-oxide reductase
MLAHLSGMKKLASFAPVAMAAAFILAAAVPALTIARTPTPGEVVQLPAAAVDMPASAGLQKVVLAGGCFWGVQGVFQHVRGVRKAVSGYAGGARATAEYEVVSSGTTGHAESVEITYDPKEITLGQILRIFFSVATDPTQLNMQYPDHGPQYRGVIFYSTPDQKRVAESYIHQLDKARVFSKPIATRVDPLKGFYPAEAYHQDYLTLHPDQPYIAAWDLPKVAALAKTFPGQYRAKPVLVGS